MVGREYQAPSSSSPVSPTLKQEGTRGAQPRVAGRAEVALRDPRCWRCAPGLQDRYTQPGTQRVWAEVMPSENQGSRDWSARRPPGSPPWAQSP